ncbi:amidohydrolase family protein [Opisthorchis viverrini]|uniref:Amidohydrolase family protein n=1 Tax=Opisthorchis viverrini TaxID=6198 RepID=A0A1S8X5Y0_OPIVI|nr:amidohydrolase family protein [Opisthorchis viverrini]
MQDMSSGTYQLGISSEFRGFNPSARISLYGSNLSEVPPAQTSYSTVYAPCSVMSTANASYSPYELCEIPASQTIAPSFTTSLPSTGLPTSGQGMRAGIPTPRTIFTQACVPGTIRFISGTHAGPQIRFVQPVHTRAGAPNRPPSSSIGTTTLTTLQPAPGSGSSTTTLRAVTYPAASASIDSQPRLIQPIRVVLGSPRSPYLFSQVPSGALSSRPATATTRLVATMSPGTNTGLIRIAPRPTPVVRLASANNVVGLRPRQPQQPVPISPAPSQNQPVSVQMAPAQFQQVQPTSLSSNDPRMTNTAWMVDGRQVILAPVVGMTGPQSPPTGTMLSPKPVIQSPPSGYIQIMPRPAGATPVSFTSTPGQQQQTLSIVHSEPQGTQNTTLYTGAQEPMVQSDGRLVVPCSQPTNTLASSQFQSNLVVTSGQSAVKIQDDLRLTEAQLSSVQSLFQGANRVSRPEKAMIVSFIAGARGNPHPETGNTLRIHLSEYRERVLNQATGQLMDVAADTYLHMDYSTDGFVGPLTRAEYEQLHVRTDKPDLLAEVNAEANEQAEFERTDEREATQAAREAWAPIQPPYIDAHFSIWSLSSAVSYSQLYLGGKMPPPPSAPWGQRLQRDFTLDDYEEEMDYMRARAEAELKYEIGELSPVRYAVHVQVASTYSESLMVSAMAEEYLCIAGYVSWCDLSDPSLNQHLQRMNSDPLLVGLRYDVSDIEGDYLLDSMALHAHYLLVIHVLFGYFLDDYTVLVTLHIQLDCPHISMSFLILTYLFWTAFNLASSSWRADLEFLSRYPNVYCKVTGATGRVVNPSKPDDSADEWCALAALSHAVSCFGPDRCIFGSGWPICRLMGSDQTGWSEQGILAQSRECGEVPGEVSAKRARRSVPLSVLNMWEAARLVEYAMGDAGYGAVEDKHKVFAMNARSVYSLTIRPYGSCPRQAR